MEPAFPCNIGIIKPNRNHPDKKVVFVGDILHFFESSVDTSNLEFDQEIEVIFTRIQYPKDSDTGKYILTRISGLMVIPVDTSLYKLVEVPRFQKASEDSPSDVKVFSTLEYEGRKITLVPGWSRPNFHSDKSLKVWIRKSDLEDTSKDVIRIVGLYSIFDRAGFKPRPQKNKYFTSQIGVVN